MQVELYLFPFVHPPFILPLTIQKRQIFLPFLHPLRNLQCFNVRHPFCATEGYIVETRQANYTK